MFICLWEINYFYLFFIRPIYYIYYFIFLCFIFFLLIITLFLVFLNASLSCFVHFFSSLSKLYQYDFFLRPLFLLYIFFGYNSKEIFSLSFSNYLLFPKFSTSPPHHGITVSLAFKYLRIKPTRHHQIVSRSNGNGVFGCAASSFFFLPFFW